MELEEVCKRFKLSDEEHNKIGNNINEIMLSGKIPSNNPIAIINIAPPGSGKTGLNGMAVNQFADNNVVVINSDELKPFHPQIDEIAKLYPQYYTKVTNQESNQWTDSLFDKAVEGNYNIIFEGTGRNIKLLKSMIDKLKGYRIIVRGMSVNDINCLMSIVERYEGQVENKGWGRLVTISHFYKAYEEMLETIQQLEDLEEIDIVEVYKRGDTPTEPIRIYSSQSKEFISAKFAVIHGREEDKKVAKQYYKKVFNEKHAIERDGLQERNEILEKLKELYKENSLEER